MFNLVPFARTWREMAHRHIHSHRIGKPLKLYFPEPDAVPIAATTIRTDEQLFGVRIKPPPHASPPTTNTLNRKASRIIVRSNVDPPDVSTDVVNTIGYRPPNLLPRKVMCVDLPRFPLFSPLSPSIFVLSHKLLFLGIHRNDWKLLLQPCLHLSIDIFKLLIPIRMILAFYHFDVGLQTISELM